MARAGSRKVDFDALPVGDLDVFVVVSGIEPELDCLFDVLSRFFLGHAERMAPSECRTPDMEAVFVWLHEDLELVDVLSRSHGISIAALHREVGDGHAIPVT
jgi:hypothetical protein